MVRADPIDQEPRIIEKQIRATTLGAGKMPARQRAGSRATPDQKPRTFEVQVRATCFFEARWSGKLRMSRLFH